MRHLTRTQIEAIERWAKDTDLDRMLTFFEAQPEVVTIPRPTLLGTIFGESVAIEGIVSRIHILRMIVRELDEPFNPLSDRMMVRFRSKPDHDPTRLGPFYDAIRKTRKDSELCLAHTLGGCAGVIVRAHMIQRATLDRYSAAGHVYHLETIGKADGPHHIKQVGVKRATTAPCFCAEHDHALFVAIESTPYCASARQHHAYHLRAAAHTLYDRKHWSVRIRTHIAEGDASAAKAMEGPIGTSLSDAEEVELELTRCLVAQRDGDFSMLQTRVWIGDVAPSIMTAELFAPRKDFVGRVIQNPKAANLAWVSLTITEIDGRALVLLIGKKGTTSFDARRFSTVRTTCVQTPRINRTSNLRVDAKNNGMSHSTAQNAFASIGGNWWSVEKPESPHVDSYEF